MNFDASLPGRGLFTNFKPVLNTKPPARPSIKFDRNSGFSMINLRNVKSYKRSSAYFSIINMRNVKSYKRSSAYFVLIPAIGLSLKFYIKRHFCFSGS